MIYEIFIVLFYRFFCDKIKKKAPLGGYDMDWKNYFFAEGEEPLDRLVESYSNTGIFRTMAFVGDSLSSGEFESVNEKGIHGNHDFYEYSWGQYLARHNGLTGYNFSRGGMTALEYMTEFAEHNGFWNPKYAAQAYVIALGANDILNRGYEIGTVDDVHPEDYTLNAPTTAGYFGQIISRYKLIQPRAKFFLVTMPREAEGGKKDELKAAHAALMHDMARVFDNCYVIDLYKYSPVYDDEMKRRLNLYSHQNPSGYIFTAKLIDSYIDYIIRRHPEDFSRVGFIGTDLR